VPGQVLARGEPAEHAGGASEEADLVDRWPDLLVDGELERLAGVLALRPDQLSARSSIFVGDPKQGQAAPGGVASPHCSKPRSAARMAASTSAWPDAGASAKPSPMEGLMRVELRPSAVTVCLIASILNDPDYLTGIERPGPTASSSHPETPKSRISRHQTWSSRSGDQAEGVPASAFFRKSNSLSSRTMKRVICSDVCCAVSSRWSTSSVENWLR
jgi:hypothetical protein